MKNIDFQIQVSDIIATHIEEVLPTDDVEKLLAASAVTSILRRVDFEIKLALVDSEPTALLTGYKIKQIRFVMKTISVLAANILKNMAEHLQFESSEPFERITAKVNRVHEEIQKSIKSLLNKAINDLPM